MRVLGYLDKSVSTADGWGSKGRLTESTTTCKTRRKRMCGLGYATGERRGKESGPRTKASYIPLSDSLSV